MKHEYTTDDLTARSDDLQAAVDAIAGIMEGTSDLIAVVDHKLRYLTFNKAYRDGFLQHFGVAVHVGECLDDALSHLPEAQQYITGCWRRALAGESHTERQIQNAPGHEHWYETSYAPLFDRSGNVVGASHIARTMSDRIRAEIELRESEEKFRTLFENAAGAIYVFGADGRVFDANRKAYEQLGYTKEELLRLSPWDIDHSDEVKDAQKRMEAIDREGELIFESVHRRKDGTRFPVEVQAKYVHYGGQYALLAVVRDLTERQRAVQASIEREELYRGLFLNDHTAMLLADPKTGRIVEANPAAAAFYGYPRKSMQGMTIGDFNPAHEDVIRSNIDQASSLARNYFELTHRLASGALREVEVFSGPVQIKGQRLLFSIVHDITEKKRNEQALRRSEAVFRSLAESNLVGVGFGDAAGDVSYVNDEMLRMMGYTREEFEAGRINWVESIAPEFRELNTITLQELERDGRSMGHEKAFVRPDGGRTPFLGGAAFIEPHSKIHVSVAVDLSPVKKAAQQLRESESKFRAFFQANPEGVALMFWEDGRFLDVNDAFLRLLGCTRDELIGRTSMDLKLWENPEERERFRWLFMEQGMVRDFEAGLRTRSGETRTVLVSADGVEWDGAQCALTVLKDISDRKRMEQRLRRKNAILEGVGRIFWDSLSCETEEDLGMACLSIAEKLTASRLGFVAEIASDSAMNLIAISDPGWEACSMPEKGQGEKRTAPTGFHIHGLYGSVLISGKPLLTNDPASHPDSIGVPEGHPQLESFLGVPLKLGERTMGMIGLGNKPGGFTAEDAEDVEALAMAIIEALMRKRAEQQVASLAKFPEENPNPVLRLRMDGTVLYANQASAFLLEHWGIQTGGSLPPGPLADVREAMELGEVQEFEVEIADRLYAITLVPVPSLEYVNIYGLDITARKAAEHALLESRRDLKRAQSVAHLGNWRMNMPEGRLEWSEETYRIFGLSQNTRIDYETFLGCVHPDDRAFVDSRWRAALQGEPYDVEHRILRKGEVRWVRELGTLDFDEERRLVSAFGTTQDITERKQIEDALRNSEERFRTVLENSRDGIHMLDLRTQRYTFMSPAQAELTGFTMQELLDIPADVAFERLHPEDQAWVETYLNQVVQGEDPGVPVEYRWKVKSGEYRWFSDSRKAIHDAEGRAVALVGVSRDVTWRRELEDQLIQAVREASEARQESERRTVELQAALVSAPIGTVFYNTDHTIGYLNKSAETLMGFTMKEVENLQPDERIEAFRIVHTDHSPYAVEELVGYRALQGEVVADEEFLVYPRGSDEPIHILSHAAPIMLDDEIIGAVQTLSDVTSRKRMEEALSRAKQEADRANKAKSEFLANMSHEIRTPLSGLLGMTDMLLDSLKLEKNITYARYMKRAGEALKIIIDDILDLSKIEAGRMEHNPVPTRIGESIHQGVALFEPMALEKGLKWSIRLDSELPESVLLDEPKFHQVLRNLVSNAIKFTDQGGIRIVGRHQGDAEHGELRVEVHDTGVGIPESRRNELFTEFTQLDSSYQKIHGGTGLGLVISRQLVTLMGGELTFSSEPDAGSSFIVTVPAAIVPFSKISAKEDRVIHGCANLRILAAEDNPINLFLLREMLGEAGCSFTLVEDGEKALDALENDPDQYDLVLMDINMPQLDGYQTTQRIRESGRTYAGIPIIALTAYAMPEERDTFMQAGLDGYLTKPFNINQLISAINELPKERLCRIQGNADGGITQRESMHDNEAQAGSDAQQMLDHAYLEAHFGERKDNLRSLLPLLEDDIPGQLEQLREHLENQRYNTAANLAHYMASGFRTVGLRYVSETCLALEQQLLGENPAEASISSLQKDIDESIAALHAWMEADA